MFKLKRLFFIVMLSLLGISSSMAQSGTSETYYSDDFESLGILGPSMPEGWVTNDLGAGFKAAFNGIDGSMCISASISNPDERFFYTHAINMGDSPAVEFYYKATGILGAADPGCMKIMVSVAEDGENLTWETFDSIPAEEFDGSSEFVLFKANLPEKYKGKTCRIKVSAYQAIEVSSNLLIDNFAMGTTAATLTHDLKIEGKLEGTLALPLHQETDFSITVMNNGSETEDNYIVALLSTQNDTLSKIQGETIEASKQKTYALTWTPEEAGEISIFAKIISETDLNQENNISDTVQVEILSEGTAITIGNGTDKNYAQPVTTYSKQTISQDLFFVDEMKFLKGTINKISYQGSFSKDFTSKIQVWIGETDSTDLYGGWILPKDMTKVFEGDITFQAGENQQYPIAFTQGFPYSGRKNLAVYIFSENDKPYTFDEKIGYFSAKYELSVIQSRYTTGESMNPLNIEGEDGSPSMSRPNTTFFFSEVSQENYSLAFTVKDTEGKELSGVQIRLDDSLYAKDVLTFNDLLSRQYSYAVLKEGYATVSGKIGLVQDTILNITMANISDVNNICGFFHEDFEQIEQGMKPFRWTGDFYVDTTGGNTGHRLTHSFWFLDGPRSITTNPIYMGSNPTFSFDYRVMDYEAYPDSSSAASNLTWKIHVSTDNGMTWTNLYTSDFGEHVETSEYVRFNLDVSNYANEICIFELYVNRDYNIDDEFYFDIDNWSIGTQGDLDLAVNSPIQASRIGAVNAASEISVTVRNIGKNTSDKYSVTLLKDGQSFLNQEGTPLDAGSAREHIFKFTPDQKGNFTLQAMVSMESDEGAANNSSSIFYFSVQEEGTTHTIASSGEAEDAITAPINFYYPYSLTQTLYYGSEIEVKENECISGIAYRTNFSKALEKQKVSIWIGETEKENLWQSFVPMNSMKMVFEGSVDFSNREGDNAVINFQTPYLYHGKNLVVCVYKESNRAESFEEDYSFYGKNTLDAVKNNSMYSENPIDFYQLPSDETGSATLAYISTAFLKKTGIEFYNVTFKVVDKNQQPISDAVITFNGVTLEKGVYTIEDMPEGTYTYKAEYQSESSEGQITVEGGDVEKTIVIGEVKNEGKTNASMTRVYPNPSTGKFFVEMTSDSRSIVIYDIYGKQVRKYNHIKAGTFEIDLSQQRSGLYLLMIDEQAFKITKR